MTKTLEQMTVEELIKHHYRHEYVYIPAPIRELLRRAKLLDIIKEVIENPRARFSDSVDEIKQILINGKLI